MIKIKNLLSTCFSMIKQGRAEFVLKRAQQGEYVIIDKLADVLGLLAELRAQISVKGLIITLMLALVVVMSAIGVVQSSHLSRQLFAEQAILLDRNDQLQLEWAQLLLEQSAWSSPHRLESIATQKLGMSLPEAEEIQLFY